MLDEIARVLKPGGLFLFDTINRTMLAAFMIVHIGESVLRLLLRGTHDPAKFLKSGGKLARIRVPAVKGKTQFCLGVPEAGIYALAIYHDRNANTKLDKTWIGLPGEPFGLSNNPPKRLAMPKLKDSAFEVNGPQTPVVINLEK